MSTYRQLKGYSVKSVSSDPSNIKEGQIWYNTSTKQIKVRTTTLASWASGNAANTARGSLSLSPVGTQTAALMFGGQNDSLSPPKRGETEEYNGTSWSEQNDMGTDRYNMGAAGTQTAGLGYGGYTLPSQTANTEEYNGTSWSEQNNLSSIRYGNGGTGVQTAAVSIGGGTYSVPAGFARIALTEEYNGSSWSTGESIAPVLTPSPQPGIISVGACGTQTATLVIGGNIGPGVTSQCTEYDGTNYADAGAIPAGISVGSYFGIQTDAVACAGQDTAGNRRMTRTLNYDGTSWTTNVATLGQGRESPMSAGSASAGLICNGFDNASPPFTDGTTEEFTGQVIATKTVDVS